MGGVHNSCIFFIFAFLSFLQDTMTHGHLLPIVDDDQVGGNASLVQTYIVHLQKPDLGFDAQMIENWHRSFLPNATLDSGEPRLVYSYTEAISGFAARLTPEELKAMEAMDGFLYAHPDHRHPLHTTYTPEFLGLNAWDGVWSQASYGEGIVIGVLDTGILPTHPSFRDDGMPPPPIKWRGSCQFRPPVCNNKLIGAAAFQRGRRGSPIDDNGHGTHVAGIAAGNFVDGAEVLGVAKGTAAGTAPKAHVAVYKVCFANGCDDSSVLAGIDRAISDGVDVLSMSLGGSPRPIYQDSVAIGSFAAVKKGIFACAAAGNFGPARSTLSHDAPWVFTVGASSADRRIRSTVRLGNGVELDGESAYQPSTHTDTAIFLPLLYPGINGERDGLYCLNGSLDYIDARSKIVLCYTGVTANTDKAIIVRDAGAAAMIVMNQQSEGYTTSSEPHPLPVSHVSFMGGRKIRTYVYSSTNSTPVAAIIFRGTVFGARPSPAVASFSSRGPSLMNGGVLKPDIIAPGVNILSAWPFNVGPDPFASKTFNLVSGTSMAAPHVSGIVALIKNKYPQWAPATIQSAIVTSAYTWDLDGRKQAIFDEASFNSSATLLARGAGHVNPPGAMDPGLVYNIDPHDYVPYLCGLGYRDWQVSVIIQDSAQCCYSGVLDAEQLNYPSISLSLGSPSTTKVITRTVTNVGEERSVYWARIDEPDGVRMDLSRYRLAFSRLDQEVSFSIQFSIHGARPRKGYVSEGRLSWVSDKRVVSSPISITFN